MEKLENRYAKGLSILIAKKFSFEALISSIVRNLTISATNLSRYMKTVFTLLTLLRIKAHPQKAFRRIKPNRCLLFIL